MSGIFAPGGGGLMGPPKVFTGNGTWTKRAGLKRIVVWTIAGGGGGGSRDGSGAQGGGGAGAAIKGIEASALGPTETVTVGPGGTAAAEAAGGTGGTSSFGAHVSALGGAGGVNGGGGPGTPGGVGSGGDLNMEGQGTDHIGINDHGFEGGHGGASWLGGGGHTVLNAVNGMPGGLYGGAGAGSEAVGGVGAPGIVVVWEYA